MENDFLCIPISDLLKNSNCAVKRGVFQKNDVWILEDNQKQIVAYQVIEEGKQPFEGVYCLVENRAEAVGAGQAALIKAFLVGSFN